MDSNNSLVSELGKMIFLPEIKLPVLGVCWKKRDCPKLFRVSLFSWALWRRPRSDEMCFLWEEFLRLKRILSGG